MLILFDCHHTLAFNNYRKLYNHLESLERDKGKGKWLFARHSYQRVLSCYQYIHDQKIAAQSAGKPAPTEVGELAFVATGDIIEMINGNTNKPTFIPVTSDIDVLALQQQWCQNYCKEHNYALFEISSAIDVKKIGVGY